MYYVYILRCSDNSLYTGITTDVARRFSEHCDDKIKGAKYTKSRKPVKIEAVWQTYDKITASRVEYRIKKLTKPKKERLVSGEATLGLLIEDTSEMDITRTMEF